MIRRINTHISNNLWLWSGISALAMVLFLLARDLFGIGYHYGDLGALSGMVLGTLLILIAQRGMPPAEEMAEEA